jgi:hypothetical protein
LPSALGQVIEVHAPLHEVDLVTLCAISIRREGERPVVKFKRRCRGLRGLVVHETHDRVVRGLDEEIERHQTLSDVVEERAR